MGFSGPALRGLAGSADEHTTLAESRELYDAAVEPIGSGLVCDSLLFRHP